MKNFITKNNLFSIAGILLVLIIWELLSVIAGSEQIFPSPERTILTVFKVILSTGFWPSLLLTIGRGLIGFVISFLLAFMIGIPAGLNRSVFLLVNPLLITLRSTPVISLILLAIIWLGNEKVPVFIAILTMFPIIATNIIEGIRHVDKSLIEMGRIYKINNYRILRYISIPSIIPFIFSGVSTALGFGWRAIIIGEVLAQPIFGIGTQMQNAQIYLQVSELIAWTFIAVGISYLFEWVLRKIEKTIIIWK